MNQQYRAYWWGLIITSLFCSITFCQKVVANNEINHPANNSFKSAGVLPYFRSNGDFYVALYQSPGKAEYADARGKRRPTDKNSAQTAARIFFPLQQHKNIRTRSIDWPSPNYLATMIFQGPWPRSCLMTMGNNCYTYMVDIQRPSSLKHLRLHPMIIVRIKDLLESILSARTIDNFKDIYVVDSNGNPFALGESFARSLARTDNWHVLRNLIFPA